jgi:hypothetical protein
MIVIALAIHMKAFLGEVNSPRNLRRTNLKNGGKNVNPNLMKLKQNKLK